jgi:hypothetical protein
VLLVTEYAHDHHVGVGITLRRLANELDAAHVGQAQIDEQNVGRAACEQRSRRGAIAYGGEQLELLIRSDHLAEATEGGGIIFDDHDFDHADSPEIS